MRKKVIKPNQQELSNIRNAEREIKEVCDKYNVKIEGGYWIWDDYEDRYAYTDHIVTRSLEYIDREKRYHAAREVWQKYKQRQSNLRFANKIKILYPNHRGLELIVVNDRSHVWVVGLRVKDWSRIKCPLFSWNPNNYWQYDMTEYDLNSRPLSTVYMSIHTHNNIPAFFAYPGTLRCGIYSDHPHYQGKSDSVASSLLIRMVDQMIELGVLEIENQVNP